MDVTRIAPEIAAFARTTLRLHPRHGDPTVDVSSFGGPLLWPAGEPWPACVQEHVRLHNPLFIEHGLTSVRTIAGERRIRELMRGFEANGGHRPPEKQAELLRLVGETLDEERVSEGPIPMVPVLQLYLGDAHGLVVGPGDADLLQILWCPFDHEPEMLPATHIRWRRADEVGAVMQEPPVPALIQNGDYLPEVCVVHPEPVTEYPPQLMLPDEINRKLKAWMESDENQFPVVYEDERETLYQYVLSVAPGCKLGGWAPVSFCSVDQVECSSCGAAMTPFFYISSKEWDAGSYPWRPIEEVPGPVDPHDIPSGPGDDEVGITIGRNYGMQIYTCPANPDHPHCEIMQ